MRGKNTKFLDQGSYRKKFEPQRYNTYGNLKQKSNFNLFP